MRLFFKRWHNNKWGLVFIVIGVFFLVTTGQGATADKPKGNIYNETVPLGVASGAGPTKSEPLKSEEKSKSKLENDKPKGNIYNEKLESVVVADVKIKDEIIKRVEHVEKSVVIALYLLIISLLLQIVALSSSKYKLMIGLFVVVFCFIFLFHTTWFPYLINKLVGLNP